MPRTRSIGTPGDRKPCRPRKNQNRPILLSIGYSACHWCHVMERESFENEAIASLMNRHFVCIKVDREERPDLDEIYMAATVTINHGQGGWPMTVFLTPDQEPFFAGTYFPPDDRWGRPGFPSLLKKIADAWEQDAAGLVTQAHQLTERLKNELKTLSPVSVSVSVLDEAVAQFREDFDERHGGFGSAPKFPPAAGLALLLRCYRRTGESRTLQMVTSTLDAMAAGGIYDHIGGGFARYSTDERWLVPHFEKMLYDNALLATDLSGGLSSDQAAILSPGHDRSARLYSSGNDRSRRRVLFARRMRTRKGSKESFSSGRPRRFRRCCRMPKIPAGSAPATTLRIKAIGSIGVFRIGCALSKPLPRN